MLNFGISQDINTHTHTYTCNITGETHNVHSTIIKPVNSSITPSFLDVVMAIQTLQGTKIEERGG